MSNNIKLNWFPSLTSHGQSYVKQCAERDINCYIILMIYLLNEDIKNWQHEFNSFWILITRGFFQWILHRDPPNAEQQILINLNTKQRAEKMTKIFMIISFDSYFKNSTRRTDFLFIKNKKKYWHSSVKFLLQFNGFIYSFYYAVKFFYFLYLAWKM